jgi:hypothetical protein
MALHATTPLSWLLADKETGHVTTESNRKPVAAR